MQPSRPEPASVPPPALVRERLRRAFGRPAAIRRREPADHLVRRLLEVDGAGSAEAEAVFVRLRARFSPWPSLANARPDELLPVLAPLGDALGHARRIVSVLHAVGRQAGQVRLDFLERWPVEEASAWLQALPWVDGELAAHVLNRSTLERRVFAADGDGLRAAARLGLVDPGEGAAERRVGVERASPSAWSGRDFSEFAEELERLGRLLCRPSLPDCPQCPVADLCPRSRAKPANGGPPRPDPSAPDAANQNEAPGREDRLDGYLRRRIAKLQRAGVEPGELLARGVALRREIDEAFIGRALPPGAHQSAGACLEDAAAAYAPALAAVSALPARPLRVIVVQEGDTRRENGELHGPGLEALGLDPREAAFVRARDGPQALEVADEALRQRAAASVIVELRRGAALADLSVTRRFNLQARRQGLHLFLLTPDLSGTSAATTRWRVSAQASQAPRRRLGPPTFRLDLVRNRSGRTGSWIVEWSAHERRFLSARPVPALGDDEAAGRPAVAAVPAPVAAATFHRPGAA